MACRASLPREGAKDPRSSHAGDSTLEVDTFSVQREMAGVDGLSGAGTFTYAAYRAAVKALDTALVTRAFLGESGREGHFLFKSGNYSARIAGDTQEGIYIKADAIAATAGAWVRQYIGPVNVKWYGATGDGATDDRADIQAAIDNLNVVGGDVFLPRETYAISNTIFLGDGTSSAVSTRSGMVLRGEGQPPIATAFGALASSPCTALLYTGASANPMIHVRGPLQGWGVQNLYLDGDSKASHGLHVASATAPTFDKELHHSRHSAHGTSA